MKKFSIILIIFLFILFTLCILYTRNTYHVLRVYSPSKIVLDLNKNGKIDENETFTVDNVESFTSKVADYREQYAQNQFINEKIALAMGHHAEKYAKSLLENKKVQYRKLKNNNIVVYFNGKNYNKTFNNSPYALEDGKPINVDTFLKQAEIVNNLQLRIFNNKSNKYHQLNCEYGQIAGDSIILPQKQLPETAEGCQFCIKQSKINTEMKKDNRYTQEQEKLKNIKPQSYSISTDKIKLILTDFTTVFTISKKCETEFCTELVKHINNSKESIDMALYGYTDIPDITNAIQTAIRRGVKVRMVYDITEDNSNFYPDTFKMAYSLVSSKADFGTREFQERLMHNKFMVFDKKIVMTGSANISTTDTSGFNANSIIFINSPELARIYEEEFEQMYNNKFHYKKARIQNKENIAVGDSVISVYFSPLDNIAGKILVPLINNAKDYIYIPSFVVTQKKICLALIDARARNVDVKIILDATNANNRPKFHEELRNAGIKVKTENYAGKMHSKTVIIDDLYTVVGSMNFSKSGNSFNDENLIVIENPKIAKFYKNFFVNLWQKIPDIWLSKNVRSESFDSIGSCFDGIDNNFDGKIDFEDEGCAPSKNKNSQKTR